MKYATRHVFAVQKGNLLIDALINGASYCMLLQCFQPTIREQTPNSSDCLWGYTCIGDVFSSRQLLKDKIIKAVCDTSGLLVFLV